MGRFGLSFIEYIWVNQNKILAIMELIKRVESGSKSRYYAYSFLNHLNQRLRLSL